MVQETREEKRREERAAADVIREEKGKCAVSHQTHVHTLKNEPSGFSSTNEEEILEVCVRSLHREEIEVQ